MPALQPELFEVAQRYALAVPVGGLPADGRRADNCLL